MKKLWNDPQQITGVQLKQEHATKRRTCSTCKVEKDWIFKRSCGMKKIYMDETKRQWNGAICADCCNKKYNTAYQKKRALRAKAKKLRAEAKAAFDIRAEIDEDWDKL